MNISLLTPMRAAISVRMSATASVLGSALSRRRLGVAIWLAVASVVSLALTPAVQAADAPVQIKERADWKRYFDAEGVRGTIIVLDGRTHTYQAYDTARAILRVSPASTYKIFNSLVALDTGAIDTERTLIPWDGKPRARAVWNRAMNLREAYRVSCFPCYQVLARSMSRDAMQAKLDAAGYGNHTIGAKQDTFWVDNSLRISPREQTDMLLRLARGELPFSARSQDIVRQISIVQSTPDYVLHGKTGWFDGATPNIGWWVGWIERDGNITAVALNMDFAGMRDAPKRERIVRDVLRDLKLID